MAPRRAASKPPAGSDPKVAKTTAASVNVDHMAEVGAAWERIMGCLVCNLSN